jgi:hypothetical protein
MIKTNTFLAHPRASDYMNKKIEKEPMFMVIGILLVAIFSLASQEESSQIIPPTDTVFDKSFAEAIRNASSLVPSNKPILVSGNLPYFAYYSNHRIAYDVGEINSIKSLIEIMNLSRINYIIVVEDQTVDGIKIPLFARENLKDFDNDFDLLGIYASDFSRILTYKLKVT